MHNFGDYDLPSFVSAPMWFLQFDHFYDGMTDFIAKVIQNPDPISSSVYSNSDSSFAAPVEIDTSIFRKET